MLVWSIWCDSGAHLPIQILWSHQIRSQLSQKGEQHPQNAGFKCCSLGLGPTREPNLPFWCQIPPLRLQLLTFISVCSSWKPRLTAQLTPRGPTAAVVNPPALPRQFGGAVSPQPCRALHPSMPLLRLDPAPRRSVESGCALLIQATASPASSTCRDCAPLTAIS